MIPVAVSEADWEMLILSAGLAMSPNPAITRHLKGLRKKKQLSINQRQIFRDFSLAKRWLLTHLQTGAQKNIVLGPHGWLRNPLNFVAKAMLEVVLHNTI